jgi:hypothetical protein
MTTTIGRHTAIEKAKFYVDDRVARCFAAASIRSTSFSDLSAT